MNSKNIIYNNKEYVVILIKNKAVILDKNIMDNIKNKIFINKNNYAYTRINKVPILLHHLVKQYNDISIDHINRITLDNRLENLRYATQSIQNKNMSKKRRNVKLPDGCKIDSQDIPTFIWYIKENGLHGDRWMVEIKHKYNWKTTSSKKYSTEYKFELAKKHLKNLIETKPEIFKEHSINGEMIDENAKSLKNEYYKIVSLVKPDFEIIENKKNYLDLKLDYLNDTEKELLSKLI